MTKPQRTPSDSPSMAMHWIPHVALRLFGVVVVTATLAFFLQRPPLQVQIDATKTRAYSLSTQTRQLLRDLEGDWTVAVVMIEDQTSAPVRRQVDEVLDRFAGSSPSLSVIRIDPTDPSTLGQYEILLASLQERYADDILAYEDALDAGLESLATLREFVGRHAPALTQVRSNLGETDALAQQFQQVEVWLGLIAQQADVTSHEVGSAREVSESQPIPDFEAARSVLALALTTWSNDLYDMSQLYGQWLGSSDVAPAVADLIRDARSQLEGQSRTLAAAADPLRRLQAMELSSIGKQFREGEAAVVIGPDGAVVIRASQLLPRFARSESAEGVVAFDQRFRGEQLIASAIRSLVVEHMPMVVFVHAEGQSLLRQRQQRSDLVGPKTMLDASRYLVGEWIVGNDADRPEIPDGQPVVWAVIPPSRQSIEPTAVELQLIRETQALITEGESIMLSLFPSLLPGFGQPDPWATVAASLGVDAATDRVIYQRAPLPDGKFAVSSGQVVQSFPGDHLLSRAIDGQQTRLDLPVPLQPTAGLPDSVHITPLVSIEASPWRWIEREFMKTRSEDDEPDAEAVLADDVPVAMAVEVQAGSSEARRALVIGSGAWMRSNVADGVMAMGGGRVALQYPGNYELLLNGIAWLAGQDDLIAQSPTSQQVARLNGVTSSVRTRWFWLLVIGMPLASIMLGVAVWVTRRN